MNLKNIEKIKRRAENQEEMAKKRSPDIDDLEMIKRIIEVYNETKVYTETTEIVNKEFGVNYSVMSIKRCYLKNHMKAFITNKKNTEFFENSFDETKQRWKECWDMMSWLMKQVKDFREMIDKQEKNQRILTAIKSIPSLTSLSKSILEQLEFIRKEQEHIKINQKNFIYSPIQLNLELKKYYNDVKSKVREETMDELVNEGKIEIISDIPWYKKKKEITND